MTLRITPEWLERKLTEYGDDEPAGLLAVSPRLLSQAEARADRGWDGSQEDAEALVFGLLGLSEEPVRLEKNPRCVHE